MLDRRWGKQNRRYNNNDDIDNEYIARIANAV